MPSAGLVLVVSPADVAGRTPISPQDSAPVMPESYGPRDAAPVMPESYGSRDAAPVMLEKSYMVRESARAELGTLCLQPKKSMSLIFILEYYS